MGFSRVLLVTGFHSFSDDAMVALVSPYGPALFFELRPLLRFLSVWLFGSCWSIRIRVRLCYFLTSDRKGMLSFHTFLLSCFFDVYVCISLQRSSMYGCGKDGNRLLEDAGSMDVTSMLFEHVALRATVCLACHVRAVCPVVHHCEE